MRSPQTAVYLPPRPTAKVAQHLATAFFQVAHGREDDDDPTPQSAAAARRKRRLCALQFKTVESSLQKSITEMLKQPAVSWRSGWRRVGRTLSVFWVCSRHGGAF